MSTFPAAAAVAEGQGGLWSANAAEEACHQRLAELDGSLFLWQEAESTAFALEGRAGVAKLESSCARGELFAAALWGVTGVPTKAAGEELTKKGMAGTARGKCNRNTVAGKIALMLVKALLVRAFKWREVIDDVGCGDLTVTDVINDVALPRSLPRAGARRCSARAACCMVRRGGEARGGRCAGGGRRLSAWRQRLRQDTPREAAACRQKKEKR